LVILCKRRIYIWLGSWQICIKKMTPQEIWKSAKKDEFYAPRLRITCLSNEFAKSLGAIGILVLNMVGNDSENSSADSDSDDDNSNDSNAS
jgi:hypothetical protein